MCLGVRTAANVNDLRVVDQLLHDKEKHVFADSGYRGIAMWSPRKRIHSAIAERWARLGRIKASIRAKVEHPFWVIKRQFAYVKARYRGLANNAAQLTTLFMLEPVDSAAEIAGGNGH